MKGNEKWLTNQSNCEIRSRETKQEDERGRMKFSCFPDDIYNNEITGGCKERKHYIENASENAGDKCTLCLFQVHIQKRAVQLTCIADIHVEDLLG